MSWCDFAPYTTYLVPEPSGILSQKELAISNWIAGNEELTSHRVRIQSVAHATCEQEQQVGPNRAMVIEESSVARKEVTRIEEPENGEELHQTGPAEVVSTVITSSEGENCLTQETNNLRDVAEFPDTPKVPGDRATKQIAARRRLSLSPMKLQLQSVRKLLNEYRHKSQLRMLAHTETWSDSPHARCEETSYRYHTRSKGPVPAQENVQTKVLEYKRSN